MLTQSPEAFCGSVTQKRRSNIAPPGFLYIWKHFHTQDKQLTSALSGMIDSKKELFMKKCIASFLGICLLVAVSGCNSSGTSGAAKATGVAVNTKLGIETVPSSMGSAYTGSYNRYTKVVAPNGKPIPIVAQDRITDEQMIRARGVLEHYLRNYPGSLYGADKSGVANRMADNGAVLALLNGKDDGSNPITVDAQPLYENEIQVEGGSWYVNQDYENHRDATYEEILHMVHDYGIGVDGPNTSPGALPAFQAEIRAAQQNALVYGLWGIGASDWITELTNENSLSQEYLAAVVDTYYGLWGAWANGDKGMHGLYIAKDRAALPIKDSMGSALMDNTFFHPYLTYNARIDASFEGTFSLRFDAALPYTHHARYLKDITLTGSNSSNVRVNGYDNDITGNSGYNTLILRGNHSEYTIVKAGGDLTITDSVSGRDGTNTIRLFEVLEFADRVMTL